MQATRLALAKLMTAALPHTLAAITQRHPGFVPDHAQLRRAETQIVPSAVQSGAVPAELLRGYARCLRLCVGSFVLGCDAALLEERRLGLPPPLQVSRRCCAIRAWLGSSALKR